MSLPEDIREATHTIADQTDVTLISHIDADGIASEAILAKALGRAGIRVRSVFIRQLEPLMMHRIPVDGSFKVFLDLGAGQQGLLAESGIPASRTLIIDHHVSQPGKVEYRQVNCIPYGLTRMSTAGLAYFVAREMDGTNRDLAPIAVTGNVGDMMAREEGGLTGPAREIVDDGILCGTIEARKGDLNCFGTSTRPVHLCLAYSGDVQIPGITNNIPGAQKFLKKIGIGVRAPDNRWLVWEELPIEARRRVTSALVDQLIASGESPARLFNESYLFPGEPFRTPLRNAQEFATLLNACGRWAQPEIGSAVCRGDRGPSFREAERMLSSHRAAIRELLQYILDAIVGIGAGMALPRLNPGKPILVMCQLPEDPLLTKVSMRTTDRVVGLGIDLQRALSDASSEIGGAGGGHRIAAGAFIRKEHEEVFVERVNRLLESQYAAKGQGNS
jgi:single-stranded-DNA-specific exonuclease